MKNVALLLLAGTIFWINPYYYENGIPILEYDRQELTTHIMVGPTRFGPWEEVATVPYGEEMWQGDILDKYWYCLYVDLYGVNSQYSDPVKATPGAKQKGRK